MKELIKIAENLNELLEMEVLDDARLEEICQDLKTNKAYLYFLADFEFYNAEKLSQISEEKVKLIKEQNFEAASNQRTLEKKCEKYVVFKKFFKLEKSLFYPDYDTLVYLFTGKSKNDRAVYLRLTAPETGIFNGIYAKLPKTSDLK